MRSVSYRLADLNRVTVPLGFRGENEHTRVIIDCKKAFDEYPNAIPSMAVSPPNGTAYPAVIVREGDLVYWDIRDSDLAKEGRGTAQLTFTEDGVVRKDDIFNTVIGKSILPAGPAPDPIADWITEANRAIGTIEGAMETAQEAAEAASGSATEAAESVTAAADHATAASESAEAAQTASGEATQKAADAAESATASASSATAAAGSANSASGSATQAAGSAAAAAGSAVEAGTSAAAAAGSATAAAESATNAAESEANASEQATAAAASEANAADSATAAATSETNAANSETNAAASATAAAESASDAANSATAASGSATAAEGSATAAAASAASAASAAEALIDDTSTATNKTWSAKKISTVVDALQKDKAPVIIDHAEGNPIVLTDGADGLPVEGMKIHLLPKQDLHGYDSPWPAGGGKNKVNAPDISNITSQTQVGENFTLPAGTYMMSAYISNSGSAGAGLRITYANNTALKTIGYAQSSTEQRFNGTFTLENEAELKLYVVGSASGYNATVKKIQIESGSTMTDYAPYSNICPIEGWTGLTAWRAGKNICPIAVHPLTPFAYWGSSNLVYVEWLNTLKPGTYSLSVTYEVVEMPENGKVAHGAPYIVAKVNGATVLITSYSVTDDTSPSVGKAYHDTATFTITEETAGKITHCYFYCDQQGTHTGTGRGLYNAKEFQVELRSTPTDYEPYTGQSYPVMFPETVYGGRLELAAGRAVVDRAKKTFNGSESWAVYTNGTYGNSYNVDIADKKIGKLSSICDSFTNIVEGWGSNGRGKFGVFSDHNSIKRLYFRAPNNSVNNLAEWKAWLAQNPIEVVYLLATPIEIPIDPITIQTLLGDNTIWSDANGTIELDYRADTKLFIAKNKQDIRATIAPIEDGTTASKAYSAGKLFYHDGSLCKAKTSIASGATFTLNTNYEITTVADELFALN